MAAEIKQAQAIRRSPGLKKIENSIFLLKKAMVRKNISLARKIYLKVMKQYLSLKYDDQKACHDEIMRLYHQRKRAEKLAEISSKRKKYLNKKSIKHILPVLISFIILTALCFIAIKFAPSKLGISESIKSRHILLILAVPIFIILALFSFLLFSSKRLMKILLEDSASYLKERLFPMILTVTFCFLAGTVILLIFIYSIRHSFSFAGSVTETFGISPVTGVILVLSLVLAIILIIIVPKWINRDLKRHTLSQLSLDENIDLDSLETAEIGSIEPEYFKVENPTEKQFGIYEEKKSKPHISIKQMIHQALIREYEIKDFDSLLHSIIEIRNFLGKERIDKAESLYNAIQSKIPSLDKNKQSVIDSIMRGVRQEIESAKFIFDKKS